MARPIAPSGGRAPRRSFDRVEQATDRLNELVGSTVENVVRNSVQHTVSGTAVCGDAWA